MSKTYFRLLQEADGNAQVALQAACAVKSFWYVATPYTRYPGGIEAAFKAACKVAAMLIGRGELVYSPIAHTHPIAAESWLDPLDHEIWLRLDRPLMDAAQGLIVAKLPTWEESYGVAFEIEAFKKAGKPIRYLEPEELSECL